MLRQIQNAEHTSLTASEAQLHGCAVQHINKLENEHSSSGSASPKFNTI
jgi:hypothetical protein